MRILITGAAGLVGSHLIPLLKKNHEIFTISSKSNAENNFRIDFSIDWSTNALPSKIDAIIHLAQSEDFRDFPNKAKSVFYTNTVSTLKLIDYAIASGAKKFIYASSAGIYGTSNLAFVESEDVVYKKEMGFYLGTKFCSEVILANYQALLDVQILRLFFVYGKGQRKDMLMPRLVNNIQNGEPINIAGKNGLSINPLHASDAANAINAALNLQGSNTINVGGEEVLSLREICETIGNIISKTPNYIVEEKPPGKIIGDISVMKNLLVTPATKFLDGIKTLI